MTPPGINLLRNRAATEATLSAVGVHRVLDLFRQLGDEEADFAITVARCLGAQRNLDVEAVDASLRALADMKVKLKLSSTEEQLLDAELRTLAKMRPRGTAGYGHVAPAIVANLEAASHSVAELGAYFRTFFANLDTAPGAPARFQALRQIIAKTGGDDRVLRELIEYLVENQPKVIAEAEQLVAKLDDLAQLRASGATDDAIAAAEKALQKEFGIFWKVRGTLGELDLANCREWRTFVSRRIRDAQAHAATLEGTWDVHSVVGQILLDEREGKGFLQYCDQAIVLVHRESGAVMIHTAMQMKVANTVEGFEQSINDIIRAAKDAPRIKVTIGNTVHEGTLVPLLGRPTTRVVAYAKGGRPAGERAAANIPVTKLVMPTTVEGYTGLTHDLLALFQRYARGDPP